jgi:hypothetical protein
VEIEFKTYEELALFILHGTTAECSGYCKIDDRKWVDSRGCPRSQRGLG